MSNIEDLLRELFHSGNQMDRVKYLRKNSSLVTEDLFWVLHFYTTLFLVKSRWTQALEMMELIMEVSDILNSTDLNKHSKYLQVACYYSLGEFSRAEEILKERINIYHILREWENLAEAFFQLGLLYVSYGDIDKALLNFNEASEYFLKFGNKEDLACCFLNIGEICFSQNNMARALIYFKKVCENCKDPGMETLLAKSLNWIGFINDLQGNLEEALEHFQCAISRVKKRLNTNIIFSLANQGRTLKKMGYYKEACQSYRDIMELRRETDFKQALAQNLYYRGLILNDLGLSDKAYSCFYESMLIFRELGQWQTELCLLFSIGLIRLNSGEHMDSISFFMEPVRFGRDTGQGEMYNLESQSFKPISFKYMNRGITEFYIPPYIGQIEFREGAIFEYTKEGKAGEKLFDLLEEFLGKEIKHERDSYFKEFKIVNRKVLQEEIIELALLSYNLGDFQETFRLFQEVISIIFYLRDDRNARPVLEILKDIYIKTGYYQKGIDFFSDLSKKALDVKMPRTLSSCYLYQGNLLTGSKRFSEAMVFLRKSLGLRRKIGEKKPVIDMLLELGKFHKDQGGYPLAEKYFKEALDECDKNENKEEKIEILKVMGTLFTHQKKINKAIEIYEQIFYEVCELRDDNEKLSILFLAGNYCDLLGNLKTSLDIHLKALIISYKIKSVIWMCRFLEAMGRLYEDLGKYAKAEACYNYRFKLSQSQMLMEDVAGTFGYISHQKFIKGDFLWAEDLINSSFELSREINNSMELWKALICGGRIKQELGKTDEAYKAFLEAYNISNEGFQIETMVGSSNFHLGMILCLKGLLNQSGFYLREAYRIYINEIGNSNISLYPRRKAYSYTHLTLICLMLGKLDECEDYSAKALELHVEMEILPGIAGICSSIGELNQKLGRYEKAEDYFKRALEIYKKIDDWMGKTRTLGDIGRLYLDMGLYGEAGKYFEMILADEKVSSLKRIWSTETHNLGYALYGMRNFTGALDKISSAVSIFKDMDYQLAIAVSFQNTGKIKFAMGNFNGALDDYFTALGISRSYGFLNQQSMILFQLGRVMRVNGDYQKSFEFLVQAKEMSQRIFRVDLIWKINVEFGRLTIGQDRYRQALTFYQQAIDELENYPYFSLLEFSEKYFDKDFFDDYSVENIYGSLIEYFLKVGQNEDALSFVQRAKKFLRAGLNRNINLLKELDNHLFLQLEQVGQVMNSLYCRLVKQEELEVDLMKEINTSYLEKKKEYNKLLSDIIKKYPHIKSCLNTEYLSLQELKEGLREGSSLIEYYFTDKSIFIFLLYCSSKGFYKLKVGYLPLPDAELRRNLLEELTEEERNVLFDYISVKFPEIEESDKIYYIICNEIKLFREM